MKDKLISKNILFEENASLLNYNTYKVNSLCKLLIKPKTQQELLYVIKCLKESNERYFLLGNGSNLILKDIFLYYNVILLTHLNSIFINDNIVEVECGAMLPLLVQKCLDNGLTNLEWASGIPGTIGGSIYNNAGAYKREMSDNLIKVEVLDKYGNISILKKEELTFGYRTSYFKENNNYIILKGYFLMQKSNTDDAKKIVKERLFKRKESQPLEYPSAGSVFRNPENNYAGVLIESSGLKGFSVGGASVSEKHANFIINKGNATGENIVNLIKIIQDKIKKDHNIDLVLEQEIIEN